MHLTARFEKAWCLGKTHLVPKDQREQLISFSQLIQCTADKYPSFKEQLECSDAEIFLTIPYLVVLKASLDTGKEALIASQVCERFFPSLFQKEGDKEKNPTADRFQQLKDDFKVLRHEAGDSFFDSYNRIERQILFEESQTPLSQVPSHKKSDKIPESGTQPCKKTRLMESQV